MRFKFVCKLNDKHWLFFVYLVAILLWFANGLFLLFSQGYYAQKGLADVKELTLDDFEIYSLVEYNKADKPEGYWLASSDPDPHVVWQGEAWVNVIAVELRHHKPAGSVELYYSNAPLKNDEIIKENIEEIEESDNAKPVVFSEKNVLYPTRVGDVLYFDVGGKYITALRLDTDSIGGVLTQLGTMTLNSPTSWYNFFIPSAGQAIVLVFLPLVVAAVLAWVKRLFAIKTIKNN